MPHPEERGAGVGVGKADISVPTQSLAMDRREEQEVRKEEQEVGREEQEVGREEQEVRGGGRGEKNKGHAIDVQWGRVCQHAAR